MSEFKFGDIVNFGGYKAIVFTANQFGVLIGIHIGGRISTFYTKEDSLTMSSNCHDCENCTCGDSMYEDEEPAKNREKTCGNCKHYNMLLRTCKFQRGEKDPNAMCSDKDGRYSWHQE